jgi:hypothetical protein
MLMDKRRAAGSRVLELAGPRLVNATAFNSTNHRTQVQSSLQFIVARLTIRERRDFRPSVVPLDLMGNGWAKIALGQEHVTVEMQMF